MSLQNCIEVLTGLRSTAELRGDFPSAMRYTNAILRLENMQAEGKELPESLELLPEPVAFIDDSDQDRLLSFEDVDNARRRAQYYLKRTGTRLDRW